jgi:hypothetical protein
MRASAYVSIRQHALAEGGWQVVMKVLGAGQVAGGYEGTWSSVSSACVRQRTSAYVSIRQHDL